jgi:hypothetical protein
MGRNVDLAQSKAKSISKGIGRTINQFKTNNAQLHPLCIVKQTPMKQSNLHHTPPNHQTKPNKTSNQTNPNKTKIQTNSNKPNNSHLTKNKTLNSNNFNDI